jgi:hypothetical protein
MSGGIEVGTGIKYALSPEVYSGAMPRFSSVRWFVLGGALLSLLSCAVMANAFGHGTDQAGIVRLEVKQHRIKFDKLGYIELGDSMFTRGGLSYDMSHWLESLMDSSLRVDSIRCARLVLAPEGSTPLWLVTNLLEPMSFRHVKGLDTAELELPGGKVVRLHNPASRWGTDTGTKLEPLRVLLEGSAFTLVSESETPGILVSGRLEDRGALDSLGATLAGLRLAQRHQDIHVVTGNRNRMPFASFAGLASTLDRATGNGFVIDADRVAHRRLLVEVKKLRGQDWIHWEAMQFRKSDVMDSAAGSDTGFGLEGLDRMYFDRASIGALMESGLSSKDEFMASSDGVAVVRLLPLLLTTTLPQVQSNAEEAEYPTMRDFPLPLSIPGHRLVLREVLLRHYTAKDHPSWLALYDNGRRTCIWGYSGAPDKVLTNYLLDKICPGKDGRLTLRLRGQMYRNGYSCEKGVELDLAVTGRGLRLEDVRNTFTFLDDREVIRTETCTGDVCAMREVKNALDRLLKSCKYVDPQTDDQWRFDWDKLLGVATCVTRSPLATVTTRKSAEPSFIEVGGK